MFGWFAPKVTKQEHNVIMQMEKRRSNTSMCAKMANSILVLSLENAHNKHDTQRFPYLSAKW